MPEQNDNNNARPPRERAAIIERMKVLAADLEALLDSYLKLPDTGQVSYGSRANQWGPHITHLARSCGNAVSLARPLFATLPFGGQDLYDQDTAVHDMGDLITVIDAVFKDMQKGFTQQRVKLMDMTFMVTDQVNALGALPLLTPEQQSLLGLALPPIEAVLAERNEQLQSSRKSGQKLRAQSDDQVAEAAAKTQLAEAEVKVLRGGKLSAPPAAPKAPKARKTKRG